MEDLVQICEDDIVIMAGSSLIEKGVFGYYFCIENRSTQKIKLLEKDWNITDSFGKSFFDRSKGFKGEIPELEPGEFFEFTDVAPLDANSAVFYGSCKVLSGDNVKNIRIPEFYLLNQNSVALH